MARWQVPHALLVTENEYRANLAGMNTFFGAVLGFVIADVEVASNQDFAAFLTFSAAVVISILYISASHHRWLYAALTVAFVAGFPLFMPDGIDVPARLQITLGVWTLMTVLLESLPRKADPDPASSSKD